jgi:hypothetical protein
MDGTDLRCSNVIQAGWDRRLRLGGGTVIAMQEALCNASKSCLL